MIRVGGASAGDREERKYRIVTALHSTRLALKNGVLPGGGSALWHARPHAETIAFGRGGKIVSGALAIPIQTHIRNAGLSPSTILSQIGDHSELGFDAGAHIVADMKLKGVVDPVTITIRSLQIAFGHAREVLQTGAWDVSKPQAPGRPVNNV